MWFTIIIIHLLFAFALPTLCRIRCRSIICAKYVHQNIYFVAVFICVQRTVLITFSIFLAINTPCLVTLIIIIPNA